MTIHVLMTPLQLPRPDLALVAARRTEVRRHALALGNLYLPALRETLDSLLNELSEVDKQALHMISGVPSLVSSEGLPDLLEALAQLRQDPGHENEEAIVQIIVAIDQVLQKAATGLHMHERALDDALVNFSAVVFGDIQGLIASVEVEVARGAEQIALVEAPVAALREEEAALRKLIAELESINFFDKLKPLVATLEKLAGADPQNPLVGSIKAAIEGLSNALSLASNALRYEHLISRRARLQAQLDAIEQQVRELRSLHVDETEKLAQFKQIQGLETPRQDYVQELGKLREALRRFRAYTFNDDEPAESRVARFIEYAGTLSTYMDQLRREWRS